MMNLKGWIAILVVCCAYRLCVGNCDGLDCKIKDCQGNINCILRMPKFIMDKWNVQQGQATYTTHRPSSTDHCAHQDCSGHGTCHSTANSYNCICNTGYSGHTCQDYICDHHQCSRHGTCHPSTHSSPAYTCTCDTGYFGQDCQDYICDNHHCSGHGTCHPSTHSSHWYTCTCDTGFSGQDCQDYICDNHYCSGHGTCHSTYNSYTCTCDTGYSGQDCQDYICSNNDCNGHGTCHPSTNSYTCSCNDGFSGPDCKAGGFLSCNATGLMEDIIMSKPASSAYASQCPIGTTRSPEAFVLNHCSVPQSPASWHKGVNVMSYCTANANQNLNLYTPVALMKNQNYITASTTDIAGVFVGCLDGGSGFKMATQSCDNNPHIVHIVTDANNYFAIV